METEQAADAIERRGVPTYVMDLAVAALLLVMGLVVVVTSHALGSGWTSDGPAAGYFPFYVGVILCISSVGTMYQAFKKRDAEIFVDHEQLRRVLVVLIPAVFYVLMIVFVGIYIASAVYIAAFMVVLGKFSKFKSIAAALIICVLLFFMFEIWFKVPLVKGSLDPLSFLGY